MNARESRRASAMCTCFYTPPLVKGCNQYHFDGTPFQRALGIKFTAIAPNKDQATTPRLDTAHSIIRAEFHRFCVTYLCSATGELY